MQNAEKGGGGGPGAVKIEALVGNVPRPFDYGDLFVREEAGGVKRLRIGLSQAHDRCLLALIAGLAGPFKLLYVLHTSRTDATLGRYESPALTAGAVGGFVRRFGRFLSEDARHDFWMHSRDDDATIVLDRHNLIYAYGPLEAFEEVLRRIGACAADRLDIPDPHVHHYHQTWDEAEREVLRLIEWRVTPLLPSDVQLPSQA